MNEPSASQKLALRNAELEKQVEQLQERVVELDVDKAAVRNEANEKAREVQRLKEERREVAQVLATAYPPDIIEEDGLAEAVRMALRSRAEARNRLEVLESIDGRSLALGEHTTREILEELRARGETAMNSAGLKMVAHADKLLTRLPSAMLEYATVDGRESSESGSDLGDMLSAEGSPDTRQVTEADWHAATVQAAELAKLSRYLDEWYPKMATDAVNPVDRAIFALETVRRALPPALKAMWREVVMPQLKALNAAGVDIRLPEVRAPRPSSPQVFASGSVTLPLNENTAKALPPEASVVAERVFVAEEQVFIRGRE